MIAQVHTIGTAPGSRFEGITIRLTEIIEGPLEQLEKEIMFMKLQGTLVGYQMFTYESTDDFHNADWQDRLEHHWSAWWDKDSYTGSHPPGLAPPDEKKC